MRSMAREEYIAQFVFSQCARLGWSRCQSKDCVPNVIRKASPQIEAV